MDNVYNMKKNSVLFLIIILTVYAFISCNERSDLQSPERLGLQDRTGIISGDEAIKVIDKMHGLPVAPDANIIAEYGADKEDLLYISYYSNSNDAQKYFRQMIEKMEKTEKSPFSHLKRLPDYESNVYFTLGMGAIHYIYCSSNYILWLQTKQSFGRELPPELLIIYPI